MTEDPRRLQKIIDTVNGSDLSEIRTVISGILRIISDPDSTQEDLRKIIEIDPPLAARVLKVANSAYYSPSSSIGDIKKAVWLIGFDAVQELAMSQKICAFFDGDTVSAGYSRIALWKHSLAVALLGKMIYRREFGEKGECMYAAGLLHDIGIIIEDQFCHDEFKQVLRQITELNADLTEAESRIFGFDHAALAEGLARSWEVPPEISVAIGSHKNPYGVSEPFKRMAFTLYVAEMFSYEKQEDNIRDHPYDEVSFSKGIEALDVSRRALDLIWGDVQEKLKSMEEEGFFS